MDVNITIVQLVLHIKLKACKHLNRNHFSVVYI